MIFECGNEIDSLNWEEKNNLSQKMLSKLDQILRRNRLGLDKISGYEIISEVPKSWTSFRITKCTFDILGLAKNYQHKAV
jgi:hypothetical protein